MPLCGVGLKMMVKADSINYLLDLSVITSNRLCSTEATKRKMEHIPNMIVIGNAFTYNNQNIVRHQRLKKKRRLINCNCIHCRG